MLGSEQTFAELMDTYGDLSKVETIEVSGDVDFSLEKNNAPVVLEFLKDKEIVLKDSKTRLLNLAGSLGVAFKKLTVEATDGQVSSGADNPEKVFSLTLDELEIKNGGKLTIDRSGILMTETAVVNRGSNNIKNVTNSTVIYNEPAAKIYAYDANNTLLVYSRLSNTWVNQ